MHASPLGSVPSMSSEAENIPDRTIRPYQMSVSVAHCPWQAVRGMPHQALADRGEWSKGEEEKSIKGGKEMEEQGGGRLQAQVVSA